MHQPDIVSTFFEFSGSDLFSKRPLLYAGASDILKRCLRLVIFCVFLIKSINNLKNINTKLDGSGFKEFLQTFHQSFIIERSENKQKLISLPIHKSNRKVQFTFYPLPSTNLDT